MKRTKINKKRPRIHDYFYYVKVFAFADLNSGFRQSDLLSESLPCKNVWIVGTLELCNVKTKNGELAFVINGPFPASFLFF